MSHSLLHLTTSVGGCDLVRFGIFSHSLDEAKGLKGFRNIQYCADLASIDKWSSMGQPGYLHHTMVT
jgi:hypothetical protein